MNANVIQPRDALLDLSRLNPNPFPRTHLIDCLRHWANIKPTAPAFWFTDGETENDELLTFAELDHAARAVAVEIQQFAKRVIGEFSCTPRLDFIIGFFGCLYAGCAAVRLFRRGATAKGRVSRALLRIVPPPSL